MWVLLIDQNQHEEWLHFLILWTGPTLWQDLGQEALSLLPNFGSEIVVSSKLMVLHPLIQSQAFWHVIVVCPPA